MNKHEIRLRCIDLALKCERAYDKRPVLEIADEFLEFVGEPKSTGRPRKDGAGRKSAGQSSKGDPDA